MSFSHINLEGVKARWFVFPLHSDWDCGFIIAMYRSFANSIDIQSFLPAFNLCRMAKQLCFINEGSKRVDSSYTDVTTQVNKHFSSIVLGLPVPGGMVTDNVACSVFSNHSERVSVCELAGELGLSVLFLLLLRKVSMVSAVQLLIYS